MQHREKKQIRNSELIDCTRETEKLRMRETECRSEGDAKSSRQIKRTIDCKQEGEGPSSDWRKVGGRDVIVRERIRSETNVVVAAPQTQRVRVVAHTFFSFQPVTYFKFSYGLRPVEGGCGGGQAGFDWNISFQPG